ncbi:hypothetical protein EJ04DRAFT_567116 [Polyplosphaeria fusca]|uniref:Uncharacterized protein n=1 Tax=Polyplosphaeria fusca TaxID=682080 RepID=A0A9P4QT34_9PLEO|nr:hypothetical protein EJ04DRAFT_567116 [Polyplosphaeria fusca]
MPASFSNGSMVEEMATGVSEIKLNYRVDEMEKDDKTTATDGSFQMIASDTSAGTFDSTLELSDGEGEGLMVQSATNKEKGKAAAEQVPGHGQQNGLQQSKVILLHIVTFTTLTEGQWKTSPWELDETIRNPETRVSNDSMPTYADIALKRRDDQILRLRTVLHQAEAELTAYNDIQQKAIERAARRDVDAALMQLCTDIITQKLEWITKGAAIERKEVRLQAREKAIIRHELLLSEGQKQFVNKLEERGLREASTIQLDEVRAASENRANYEHAQAQAEINHRIQELDAREENLKLKEANFLVEARHDLELRIREQVKNELLPKVHIESYNTGHADGKKAGLAANMDKVKSNAFKVGYVAGLKSTQKMTALRNGELRVDSPEMAFLFDHSHPENPFNLGPQIAGLIDVAKEAGNLGGAVNGESSTGSHKLNGGAAPFQATVIPNLLDL